MSKIGNNQNKNLPRQSGVDWKPAVEIFSQVSTWVVVPIVLALITGKYLDARFDTKPWMFLALTGLAFVISCFGIVRVVGKYMKKIIEDAEKEKNNRENFK